MSKPLLETVNDVGNSNINFKELNYNIKELKSKILSVSEIYKDISQKVKKTCPILTKYEKAKILCIRVAQLSKNAPTTLENVKASMSIIDIAEEEIKQKKVPFIIRRYLTRDNTQYEDWLLSELIID